MSCKRFSQIDRYQVASLMKAQHSITQIANLIGRHKSMISRELRRNAGARGYRPKQASELAIDQSKQSRTTFTVAPWVKEHARALLRSQWSSEQIVSRLPVSQETLYPHVYADKTQGDTLLMNLRCQKQKRKRYCSGPDRRGQIPNRRLMSERPAHIEVRKQVGHGECNAVIGANHKPAIVTVVERRSGYTVMVKVSNKTVDLVSEAIIKAHPPLWARGKTPTYNNGKEFCGHALIDGVLKSTSYFARPFGSRGRGCNVDLGFCHNVNGLLLQYVLKKRPIKNINDEKIKMIEKRFNNRLWKLLGFIAPAEVFLQSLSCFELRA